MQSGQDATAILTRLAEGDDSAAAQLMPLLYDELRALAGKYLQSERPDHTLEPTALVNEAFLKMVDQTRAQWESRAHFFAIAATVMRRILMDHARRKGAAKRGGGQQRVTLSNLGTPSGESVVDIEALDQALEKLAGLDARQYKIVELRYFGGLTVDEVADMLEVSKTTVEREWRMIRAWLSAQLRRAETS